MTAPSGAVPAWYPDPDDRISERYWDGHHWRDRRPRHSNGVVTAAIVLVLLQGCAVVSTIAPTCHPHSPVSTASTTPVAVPVLLFVLGIALVVGIAALWRRHDWTPRWLPLLLLAGVVLPPPVGWVLSAASCGL